MTKHENIYFKKVTKIIDQTKILIEECALELIKNNPKSHLAKNLKIIIEEEKQNERLRSNSKRTRTKRSNGKSK